MRHRARDGVHCVHGGVHFSPPPERVTLGFM